jgi:hypothetical protein
MAHNDDLIRKIQELQGRVDGSILPLYEQAKASVDNLQQQLDSIVALGKFTKAGKQKFDAIENLQKIPQAVVDNLQKPAEVQQKIQASLSGLADHLMQQAQMGPKTGPEFQSLKTAAFAQPLDPAAQQAFQGYVSNLQSVHTENLTKDMRTWVQGQIKQGLKVTLTDFTEKQRSVMAGTVMGPEDNPETQKAFNAASGRGLGRVFSRDNFGLDNARKHWSSGEGYTIGYAALDLGRSAVEVADIYQNGKRYTREAQDRAWMGMIPGAATVAGGVLGAFTPVGPVAGAGIAGGIASAATGFFSAQSERHEDLRLSSETIALQLGRSTAAATKFADMIDKTADRMSVPAAELAKSSVAIASAVTNFGANGVSLQARLSRGLGDTYTDYVGTQQQAASLPFSRSYREMLSGSVTPDASLFGDAAFYYAFTGDQDNMKKQAALQNVIAPGKDYQQYVADQQASKPMDWWEAAKQTGLSVLAGTPSAAIRDRQGAIRRTGIYEATHAQTIAGAKKAAGDNNNFLTNVYEDSRTGRETALYGQTLAGVPYRQMQQAEERGQGLAGLRRYSGAELTDLGVAYGGVTAQESLLTKRLADKSLSADRRKMLSYLLANTQGQALDIQGQILGVKTGLFRQGLSEEQARFGGGYSRLGISGDELTLGGASSFDPRVARNVARRRAFLTGQAGYDLGLASDMTNYLTPEEREGRRTAAKQESFEARFVLPNQQAVQRIGDTTAASQARQADIRTEVTRAQVAGGITASLVAQNKLIDEQVRLQGELKARMAEGNLTYQQRTQLTAQIKDSEAQTLEARKQAMDTAAEGFADVASARSSIGSAKAARETTLRGTSTVSFAQTTESYQAGVQRVALLKLDAELETNPDRKVQKQAVYQQAYTDTEQQGIEATSQVQMGPDFRRRQTLLQHKLGRQERSPFEPDSILTTNSQLAALSGQQLAAYDAQMRRVMSDPTKSAAEKQAILANLTEGREDVRDQQFGYQQSVDVGWVDRLVSMSVNAPSFAARLMPGSDRVAALAEQKGFGRMSARVFGYTNQQSYRDAEGMGVLPSEMSRFAFGQRPGDMPGTTGPDTAAIGGTGRTLDSIDAGGAGSGVAGLNMQAAQMLLQAAQMILQAAGTTQNHVVHVADPNTGTIAARTQNAQTVYGAGDIMAGGKAPSRY